MSRSYDSDTTFVPTPGRASEYSTSFSDLRADPDTRRLRLWLRGDVDDDGASWKSIDIARGGWSILRKFNTAEYASTSRNDDLLKQMSRSAFTLFQPGNLTDQEGNLIAISLGRNSSLMLGRSARSPFDALRGPSLSRDHVGLYVDDDDVLGIEAYNLENTPQIEVIAADSETAIQTGLAARNYLAPRQIPGEGVRITHAKPVHPPLNGNIHTHPPQFLTNIAVPISDHIEQFAESR